MYKQEDIFKALQAGANPDDLVRQFTDAMNAAINQKNAEDQKKKQAYAQKVAAMQAIIEDVCDFLVKYYPELPVTDDLRAGVDAHDILEGLDASVAEITKALNVFKMVTPAAQKTINVKQNIAAEDALKKFLKNNGLV